MRGLQRVALPWSPDLRVCTCVCVCPCVRVSELCTGVSVRVFECMCPRAAVHTSACICGCVSARACEGVLYPFLSFRKAEASSGQSPLSSLCSLVVKWYEGQFSNLVLPVLTSHQCVLGKNGQKQFYSIIFPIGSIPLNVQHLFYCNLSKFSTLFLLLYIYF